MKRFIQYVSVLTMAYLPFVGHAQGQAQQFGANAHQVILADQVPTFTLQPFNWTQIYTEDGVDEKNGNWPRMAVAQSVNMSMNNSGTWQQLPNGDRMWKIRIKSQDALGLIFSFQDIIIPQGAKVSVYNDDMSDILGAFDASYSPASGIMAIGVVKGEAATVEYYEPLSAYGQGRFTIFEVAHAYRLLAPQDVVTRDFGDSDPCQVNVNCTPEGTNWQDEKRGVARILLKDGANWGWCTGSLVNNTAEDCHPYFLTAYHCGETSSTADKNQWFFYFNYESAGCSNGSNPILNPYNPPAGSPTTQGCALVAHSNDGGGSSGSDFLLVDLVNLTPTNISNWNLYFNGWDRSNTAPTNGVGIHHPSGDIKKISKYNTSSSSTWGGTPGTHWALSWVATANGHGVTEGGSSGSPLFNGAGRIVGTLTGGSSFCSAPTNPDRYGKMWYHWAQNSNPVGGDLSQFLDPGNTGSITLDGTYSPCTPAAPTCAASASATSLTEGGSVDFFDNSTGVPTSWSWNFGGGGAPATSTTQNPSGIVFNSAGTYTVTMTATNAQGSCTSTIVINVLPSTGCDTLNFLPPGTLIFGYGSSTLGYVTGTNSFGDLAKVQRFDSYAPYTHVTGGLTYIAQATDGGGNAIARFHVYNELAGEPGTSLASLDVPLSALANIITNNAGPSLVNLSFNQPVNVGGNPFYFGVEMVNFAAGDTIAIITNSAGDGSAANNSWEMWNDGSWHEISSSWTLPNDPNDFIDLFFSPYMTDLPVTANITATGGTSVCSGASLSFDGSGSTNATGYDWTLPGGTPSTGTGAAFTASISAAGTYTIYLEASGACNGYSVDSVNNLTISASPIVTATPTAENCGAGDGTITATGTGGSGAGYQYSLNGGAFQGSGNFTGLSAGTYSITVQDGNGCEGTTSVTVSNNAGGISIAATTVNDPCGSGNGGFTAIASGGSGSYLYSIDGTNFQPSSTFSGLFAGTYTVFAEDQGNGCTGNTTVTVNANNYTLTVFASATDENCGGSDGTITVSATGGTAPFLYSIDGGATTQGTGSFNGLSSNTYNVVVTDNFGCSGTSSASVGNAGGPTINATINNNPLCAGGSTGSIVVNATGATSYTLNGGTPQASSTFSGLAAGVYIIVASDGGSCDATSSVTLIDPITVSASESHTDAGCTSGGTITVTAAGGSGGYTYSIDGGITTQGTGNFTNVSAGSYSVVVIDANGCSSATVPVTIGSTTGISFTQNMNDETCNSANGSIVINAAGGDGNYTYSINGGATTQSTGTFNGLSAGTYNLLVEDGSGCTSAATVTLIDQGAVNGTVTPSQNACSGDAVILQATGGTSYTWTPGGQTTATITVTPTATTAYSVLIDNGTCTQLLNTTVTVNTTPVTSVSSDVTICDGESINLIAGGGSTYQWTPGGQTTSTITVSPSVTTTYQVTAFNGICAGSTETVLVTVSPAPTAVASANPTTVSLSSGGTINFSSTGSTSTGVTYVWDFNDGNTSSNANPAHSFNAAGTYDVLLIVSDANCSSQDIVTVNVIDDTQVGESIFAEAISVYPNPTSDVLNLSFALASPRDMTVEVYNAIGELIKIKQINGMSTGIETLNFANEANGFYFVQVRSENDAVTMRVSVIK